VVLEEMWRYQLGATNTSPPPPAVTERDRDSLLGRVVDSECEMERLGAAYTVARLGDGAVASLAGLLVHPLERTRRAAAYGMSVGVFQTAPPSTHTPV
jgi:hypothetical protein